MTQQLVKRQAPDGNPFALAAQPPQSMVEEEEAFSLRHYLEILHRRKWVVFFCLLAAVLFTAINISTITPLYRSTATIQIDPEERLLPYENIGASASRVSSTSDAYINTQLRKLSNPVLTRKVVEELDLSDNPDFTQPIRGGFFQSFGAGTWVSSKRWIRGLLAHAGKPATKSSEDGGMSLNAAASRARGYVSTSVVRGTRLIQVSYSAPDRFVAADVANAFAHTFVRDHMETKYLAINQASEYLRERLQDLETSFEEADRKMLEYAREHNLISLSDRDTLGRNQLTSLLASLTRLEEEVANQTARYEAVSGATPDNLPDSLKDETFRTLESSHAQLQQELAAKLGQFGPEWPAVKELRLEIEQLEVSLQGAMDGAVVRAQQELELTRNRYRKMSLEVVEQKQAVAVLDDDSFEYQLLRREAETNKQLYEGVLTRLKQAGVAAGLASTNIRVIAEGSPSSSQYTPNRSKSMSTALLFGLCAGIALAFILELFDNSLKSAEDVTKHLGLPSLGVVPNLQTDVANKARSLMQRIRRRTGTERIRPGNPILAGCSPESNIFQPRAREAYRSLRTSLLLSNSDSPPQTILVSSALPGEGKSTTSTNTAAALAQTGNRTLLIDLDLRKPSLSDVLGVESEHGMSGFLSGNSDLSSQIVETKIPNLYLISAGSPPPNPPELIGSQRMATGFGLLKDYFTYIVIDTPPSLEMSDALIASTHADGVILVARGGSTPRHAVRRAANQFAAVGSKVLGVLLNDLDSRRRTYGYYGYGRYSRYYRSYYSSGSTES